jgi:hypothetical protein
MYVYVQVYTYVYKHAYMHVYKHIKSSNAVYECYLGLPKKKSPYMFTPMFTPMLTCMFTPMLTCMFTPLYTSMFSNTSKEAIRHRHAN